ncbi:MAG: hypothetical protein QMD46_06795 [Methanomicrobiales archaeon]|nr:hypothetical protein [Methanomicrobiales archaeon]
MILLLFSIYGIYMGLCQALCIYSIYQALPSPTDVRGGTRAFLGILKGDRRRVFIPVSDFPVLYRDDFSVYTILYIHTISLYPFWRGVP